MKKLILSCLIGMSALSAAAVEGTVTYTYAYDQFRTWGRFKSQAYDVAILVNDPAFVGKKITSIRAVLNAYEGVESTSVWLSKELTLATVDGVKKNVPDTYSTEANLEKTTLPGVDGTLGQLSATLDTPYELTAEGIYVGYSLTVPKAEAGADLTFDQKQPVLVSQSLNPNSFYVRASKDVMSWTSFNDKLHAGAAIYVTFEGDFQEHVLGLESLSPLNVAVDEDFALKASVLNTGCLPVSSIGYTYKIGGKDYDATLNLDTPIEPNFVSPTKVAFPIEAVGELGSHSVKLKITSVDGAENKATASSATTFVSAYPFVPVHRPLVEEFTGTWCGWCTRGLLSFQLLERYYGDDVVLAAYHIGDPMTIPGTPFPISGCPCASLNRNGLEDPFYGYTSQTTRVFGMNDEVLASMESLAPAAFDVTAEWADEQHTSISVKTVSRFVEAHENANFRVGYLLLDSGLTGTGPDWVQNNTYGSNKAAYVGSELHEMANLPDKIVGMEFDDVVVDTGGMRGVEGSLPSDIAFNTPYEYDFIIDISENTKIQNKDRLTVAAFILNSKDLVANADKAHVGGENAVGSIESRLTEVSAEYYNLSGIRVANPQSGIFLKVSKMSDGSIRTSKIAR